jgi:DNA-binding HxlR family transcriptional regulator
MNQLPAECHRQKDWPVRFNNRTRQLGGASRKMVYQRLKEMAATGLVNRTVLSTGPVAYGVTDSGGSSLTVLEQLKERA